MATIREDAPSNGRQHAEGGPADVRGKTPLPLFDNPPERERCIRLAAYRLYEARGCEAGHELEDWLAAEAEIDGHTRAAAWYDDSV